MAFVLGNCGVRVLVIAVVWLFRSTLQDGGSMVEGFG